MVMLDKKGDRTNLIEASARWTEQDRFLGIASSGHDRVAALRERLADLATLVRNTVVTAITPHYPLTVLTRPTPVQHKALALLGVTL